MPMASQEEQFKFLISCIRYSCNGKVDFAEVAKECQIVSKGAAAKRYERMMKQHGLYQSAHSPKESAKPTRSKEVKLSPYPSPSDSPTTPKRRQRKPNRKSLGKDSANTHEESPLVRNDQTEILSSGTARNMDEGEQGSSFSFGEVKTEDSMMNITGMKCEPVAYEPQGLAMVPGFHDIGAYHPAVVSEDGYHLEHGAGGGFHHDGEEEPKHDELAFSQFLQPGTYEDGLHSEGGFGQLG